MDWGSWVKLSEGGCCKMFFEVVVNNVSGWYLIVMYSNLVL